MVARATVVPAFALVRRDDPCQRAMESRRENAAIADRIDVRPCQHHGIRERIEFPLPFPDVVVRSERVGVRIDGDVAHFARDHRPNPTLQQRPVPGETHVRQRLGGRVAQPHGRDVARLHVNRAVRLREEI